MSRTSTADGCVVGLFGDLCSVNLSSGLECGNRGEGMVSGAWKGVRVTEELRKVCKDSSSCLLFIGLETLVRGAYFRSTLGVLGTRGVLGYAGRRMASWLTTRV